MNRHFALAYLLGPTRLSFIRLTGLERSIYVTDLPYEKFDVLYGHHFNPGSLKPKASVLPMSFSDPLHSILY